MAKQITVLNAAKPGNSFALWLAMYQPDLFLTALKATHKAATKSKIKRTVGRLADDGDDALDFSSVDTSSLDTSTPSSADLFGGATDFSGSGALPGGDLFSNDSLGLDTLTLDDNADLSTLNPLLVTDQTSSGSAVLNSAAAATTSSGSTVGSILSSIGTSVLGAVAAVGNALSQPKTLQALTQAAQSYYSSQTAQSNAAAAQAAYAAYYAQASRASSGQTAAPITYVTNPATGQQQPAYATTLPNGQVQYTPLTTAQLAQLAGSGLSSSTSKLGLWLVAGAAVLLAAFVAMRKE